MKLATLSASIILLGGLYALTAAPALQHAQEHAASDTTETKPLRLLMATLGQDMSRISTGLWYEDYDLMREGAEGIAHHPRILPEQVAKIQQALGEEFQAFVRFDEVVHRSAAELVEAALERDLATVLEKHSTIRNGCIGCHSAYRDRVRSALSQ